MLDVCWQAMVLSPQMFCANVIKEGDDGIAGRKSS